MREPISGHEVVKKKRDCNNLEKETAGLEKVKVIARIHTDFPTKFGIPRQSGLSDATGLLNRLPYHCFFAEKPFLHLIKHFFANNSGMMVFKYLPFFPRF